MKINIECSTALKKYISVNECTFGDGESVRIADLISRLGVKNGEIGFATANGVKVDFDYSLKNEDTIKFYPKIIAG